MFRSVPFPGLTSFNKCDASDIYSLEVRLPDNRAARENQMNEFDFLSHTFGKLTKMAHKTQEDRNYFNEINRTHDLN